MNSVILIETEYVLVTPKPQLNFGNWFKDFLSRLEKLTALYLSETTKKHLTDESEFQHNLEIPVGLQDTEVFEEKFKVFIKSLLEKPDEQSSKTYESILKGIARITPCSELDAMCESDEIIPFYYIEQFFNDADLYGLTTHFRPYFVYKFNGSLESSFALAAIVYHFPFIKLILWNENTSFDDLKKCGDELDLFEKDFEDPDLKVASSEPKKFIEEIFPIFFLKKSTFNFKKNFYYVANYFLTDAKQKSLRAQEVDDLGIFCEICSLRQFRYKLKIMDNLYDEEYRKTETKMKELIKVGWNYQGSDLETQLMKNNLLLDAFPIFYTYFDVLQSREPKDFDFVLHNYASSNIHEQKLFKEYYDMASSKTTFINDWKDILIEQTVFQEAYGSFIESDEDFKKEIQKIDPDKNIEIKLLKTKQLDFKKIPETESFVEMIKSQGFEGQIFLRSNLSSERKMYAVVLPASVESVIKKIIEKSENESIIVQELIPHFCTIYDAKYFLGKIDISAYYSIPNEQNFEEHGGYYEFSWQSQKENLDKVDQSLIQFLVKAHKNVLEKICMLFAKKFDLKYFALKIIIDEVTGAYYIADVSSDPINTKVENLDDHTRKFLIKNQK